MKLGVRPMRRENRDLGRRQGDKAQAAWKWRWECLGRRGDGGDEEKSWEDQAKKSLGPDVLD